MKPVQTSSRVPASRRETRACESTAAIEAVFESKLATARGAKALLAIIAAELVPPDAMAFVDAGSTCFEVGRHLLARRDVHLVTNSLPLLLRGMDGPAAVSALGGRLRRTSLALAGGGLEDSCVAAGFDVAFVGASGIDADRGPCTTEPTEALVKAAALARARRRVLVVHAAKWEGSAAVAFADWAAFTHVVTDARLAPSQLAALTRAGVTLLGLKQG